MQYFNNLIAVVVIIKTSRIDKKGGIKPESRKAWFIKCNFTYLFSGIIIFLYFSLPTTLSRLNSYFL